MSDKKIKEQIEEKEEGKTPIVKSNNTVVFILMGVIIVILAVICTLFITGVITVNNKESNNKKETTTTEQTTTTEKVDTFGLNDTFSNTTESGQVDVLGYAEVQHFSGYNALDDEDYDYNYIYFHIIDTKNNDFLSYIDGMKGNSFVSERAIGLGCNIDNLVNYYNYSDEKGYFENTLSVEDSSKILNSTSSNPIKLRLNKLPLSMGGGASYCYSHMTTIEIID